mgnify:CR=1 FL=1
MTFLVYERGKARPRAWCGACRCAHAPKDCPGMEGKIIIALSSWGIPGGSREIAKALGVPWRRVQQTVGRLLRADRRQRLG